MTESRKSKPRFNRRRFLQIVAVAGAGAGLYQFGIRPTRAIPHIVRESRKMMGTQINLIVCGPDQDACLQGVEATLHKMGEVEQLLSRHLKESELSRLNRYGVVNNPSHALQSILSLARDVSMATDGAFDITVLPLLDLYATDALPTEEQLNTARGLVDFQAIEWTGDRAAFRQSGMSITVDGIGKGYIVDQGVAVLQELGFHNVYVEAGGDLMVSGAKPQGKPWRIGVRNPRPQNVEEMMVMEVSRPTAIATSGDYMQWFTEDMRHHHIIDPRTGMSPPELASATVTAPSVAMADGLATAAMVQGPEKALATLETMEHCEGLLIDKDLRQYRTSGFEV
ncbi:FAD:protein FMN transferase [Desulfogranum marinum]|uniref:FAD:protein FMN transferase n=1 Tax=Desulfogranum marinum TaxID=453220 RepID=UPI0019627961|nr:FAD:protein FMN transferase [Desulfogranum marinum]MBM9512818.1 FAD:protein FMN transferase [Desulfogranum marinum]